MNTDLNSPITDSRHHNSNANDGKKANKLIIIAVAILIFMMGLGAVFFLLVSEEPIERTVTPTENY